MTQLLVLLHFLVPLQYLKSARGFDIAAIGKFAWIPFLTADAGNLIGGACAAALLNLGDPRDVGAQGIHHVVRGANDLFDSGGACVQRVRLDRTDLDRDARYTGALSNMLAMRRPTGFRRTPWVRPLGALRAWALASVEWCSVY